MINLGDLDRGARTLGNPQYVITQRNCDEADPTCELWNAVIDKARALHPDDDSLFDEYTECERNESKPWGCGGISDDKADIHFAAVGYDITPETGGRPKRGVHAANDRLETYGVEPVVNQTSRGREHTRPHNW